MSACKTVGQLDDGETVVTSESELSEPTNN